MKEPIMTEQAQDMIKQFDDAPDDSWWHCQTPTCHCAYQKSECEDHGVCPYCNGQAYNNKPWDWAILNNPQFPQVPESGRTYAQKIV
jgi:hypothetical protein